MKILKRTKILALGIFVGLGLVLSGCDLLGGGDDEGKEPEITGFAVTGSNGTVYSGVVYNLEGTITANGGITAISIKLTDAAGTDVTITPVAGFSGQTSWSLASNSQTMTPPVNLQAGAANLVITATAEGGKTKTATATVTIDMGTPLIEGTVTAGSSGHATLGSSIDLDADLALLSADAAAVIADIDIVYLTDDGVDGLYSPSHAATVVTWSSWSGLTPPVTSFMKTNLDAAGFAGVVNEERIEQLWNAGTPSTTTLACAQGDVFIVESTDGWLTLVLIETQTPGATGTIQIKSMQ